MQNFTTTNMPTILDTIGNTPLVRLQRIGSHTQATILLKLEYFNPGLSIKDRIVKHIIEDAEKTGKLLPGGTIIESTSGNTGAAAAMIGAIKGYRVLLTMPAKVSIEKQNALKAYGAEIIICPTEASHTSPENYVNQAARLQSITPGSFRINQYDNLKNPEAHYLTTGPEIWKQTGGQIDYFVAAGSTGGTVSGTGKYLKEKKPDIKIILPDPIGSVYYDYVKTGQLPPDAAACTYQLEGIGEDHLVGAMDFSLIDDAIKVTDANAFAMVRRLAREEGILCGGSTGANLWGALQIAETLREPKTIVVMAPDSGVKYLSKIFNVE